MGASHSVPTGTRYEWKLAYLTSAGVPVCLRAHLLAWCVYVCIVALGTATWPLGSLHRQLHVQLSARLFPMLLGNYAHMLQASLFNQEQKRSRSA